MTQKPGDLKNWLPAEEQLKRVAEAVAVYNAGRPAKAAAMKRRMVMMLGPFAVIVAAIAIIGLVTGVLFITGIAVAVAIFGGMIVLSIARKPARNFQQQLRASMFPEIFGFIDDFQYRHGHAAGFLGPLEATGMLSYTSASHDDWFAGSYDGVRFELAETHLKKKSGKNTRTIFDGLIFHIRLDSHFRGLLLAQRKADVVTKFFRDLFGNKLREIQTGIGDIDATHDFRTNADGPEPAQLAARMAKALDWLADTWPHGPVQIAFADADCYLLLAATKDHFELPGITQGDIDFDRHILPMIRDMATLLAIASLIGKVDGR